MRAMVLKAPGQPLELENREIPRPKPGELLLKVRACAVCRTDLHVVDGDLPPCRAAIVPGHEIVGEVAALGEGVTGFQGRAARGRRLARPYVRPLRLLHA